MSTRLIQFPNAEERAVMRRRKRIREARTSIRQRQEIVAKQKLVEHGALLQSVGIPAHGDTTMNSILDREEAFHERYHGRVFRGHIRWFDGTSGEGVLQLEDGMQVYVHFSAIEGIDRNNYSWPLEADQERLRLMGRNRGAVDVTLAAFCGFRLMAAKVVIQPATLPGGGASVTRTTKEKDA